ncbi:MAG: hypothetical protein IKU49_05425 [Prevotella sp.]|nr:hypothetical protein [Prevotella sp.]
MNHLKHALCAAILLAASAYMPASAKNIMVPKAYMFGFIASFNDSIVFFTDIQEVDSVWVMEKKKVILAGRSNYAAQLRDFFSKSFNLNNRTCVVISGTKRKDVEKKYAKLKKQYTVKNANKYDVHYVDATEFKFRPVNMEDSDQEIVTQPKKKKDKKQKPPKDGKMPPPPKK